MNVRLVTMLLALWLPTPAATQGYAGLGTAATDYAAVIPGVPLVFPRDHGAHPDFRIEWWYLTANLTAEDGTPMGLQWTLFRQAMQAPPSDGVEQTGWSSRQLWMGHAAVTTPDAHHHAELFARGGIGQAVVDATPFRAWIDDWEMASTSNTDPFDALTLRASGDDFSYSLELAAHGPLVRNGDAGFSVKSDAGQASYYYSQPFYTLTGTVTLDGRPIQVQGQGWLDREWSTQPLTADQTGWDWLSLHMPDGGKLMVYGMRQTTGRDYLTGTHITSDGTPTPLEPGVVTLTPERIAQVGAREIPVAWRIQVPAFAIDIRAEALNDQSFMDVAFPYWEGPVTFDGTHAGVGYLEMTGY